MYKKCKLTPKEMEFEEEDWICEDCKNDKYHLCICGNRICTICGWVDKRLYPLHIFLHD